MCLTLPSLSPKPEPGSRQAHGSPHSSYFPGRRIKSRTLFANAHSNSLLELLASPSHSVTDPSTFKATCAFQSLQSYLFIQCASPPPSLSSSSTVPLSHPLPLSAGSKQPSLVCLDVVHDHPYHRIDHKNLVRLRYQLCCEPNQLVRLCIERQPVSLHQHPVC